MFISFLTMGIPGRQNISAGAFSGFAIFLALALYLLATFLPTLAINIRRLQDGGFPWGFIFFNFIPYIGPLALLVFYCLPSEKRPKPSPNF